MPHTAQVTADMEQRIDAPPLPEACLTRTMQHRTSIEVAIKRRQSAAFTHCSWAKTQGEGVVEVIS